MFRNRFTIAVLLLSLTSWLVLSLASLNADYKAEVTLAPMGSGHVPIYSEFLAAQGFGLLAYFVPYHPNPVVWLLGVAGGCLFFMPLFAVLLAAHTSVRLLCVLVVAFFTYASFEVLFAFPMADRNGCESCDNVAVFHALAGIWLLVVAAGSRVLSQAKRGHGQHK